MRILVGAELLLFSVMCLLSDIDDDDVWAPVVMGMRMGGERDGVLI